MIEYNVSVYQLLASAPLRGVALEAAAEVDLERVASNREVLSDAESVEFLLRRLSSVPSSAAADLTRAAVELLDPEVVLAAVAADKRAGVRDAALTILPPDLLAQTLATHPSVSASAFYLERPVDDEGLELLLASNADEHPFAATLAAAVSPQVSAELAAQAFLAANVDKKEARWWAPMLAAHMLLERFDVLEHLVNNEWASRPLSTVELAHLLCGPLSPEAEALVAPLLSRDITVKRLTSADIWDQRILFWYATASLFTPAATRDLVWDWAPTAPASLELPDPSRRSVWFEEAAPLLLDRLNAGSAPIRPTVGGLAEPPDPTWFRRGVPDRWEMKDWVLSAEDWQLAAAAIKMLYWASPQKHSGYAAAMRILWIDKLLPLFSELCSEDRLFAHRVELTEVVSFRDMPASLRHRLRPNMESARAEHYVPRPASWIVAAYEQISTQLGDDATAWTNLFELCNSTGISPLDAVAIVR